MGDCTDIRAFTALESSRLAFLESIKTILVRPGRNSSCTPLYSHFHAIGIPFSQHDSVRFKTGCPAEHSLREYTHPKKMSAPGGLLNFLEKEEGDGCWRTPYTSNSTAFAGKVLYRR